MVRAGRRGCLVNDCPVNDCLVNDCLVRVGGASVGGACVGGLLGGAAAAAAVLQAVEGTCLASSVTPSGGCGCGRGGREGSFQRHVVVAVAPAAFVAPVVVVVCVVRNTDDHTPCRVDPRRSRSHPSLLLLLVIIAVAVAVIVTVAVAVTVTVAAAAPSRPPRACPDTTAFHVMQDCVHEEVGPVGLPPPQLGHPRGAALVPVLGGEGLRLIQRNADIVFGLALGATVLEHVPKRVERDSSRVDSTVQNAWLGSGVTSHCWFRFSDDMTQQLPIPSPLVSKRTSVVIDDEAIVPEEPSVFLVSVGVEDLLPRGERLNGGDLEGVLGVVVGPARLARHVVVQHVREWHQPRRLVPVTRESEHTAARGAVGRWVTSRNGRRQNGWGRVQWSRADRRWEHHLPSPHLHLTPSRLASPHDDAPHGVVSVEGEASEGRVHVADDLVLVKRVRQAAHDVADLSAGDAT